MERNRYIHTLRETPYKVDIEGRISNDDLIVNIYGIDGNQIGRYCFTAAELKGKRSIHFKYVDGKIVWLGGVIPSSL
jgi:hypothetical protein